MSRLSKQKPSKVIEILNRSSDEEVAEVWKDRNGGRPVKSGLSRPKRLLLEQHPCDGNGNLYSMWLTSLISRDIPC